MLFKHLRNEADGFPLEVDLLMGGALRTREVFIVILIFMQKCDKDHNRWNIFYLLWFLIRFNYENTCVKTNKALTLIRMDCIEYTRAHYISNGLLSVLE